MKIFSATPDPKVARIQSSWFQPAERDARWLASIADEVNAAGAAPAASDGFVYVSLDPTSRVVSSSALAIPVRAFELASLRIPALRPDNTQRVTLAA